MIPKIAALTFVASLVFPKASRAADGGVRMVAAEIQRQIAAVRSAVIDAAGEQKRPDQVCFRVGNLYQSTRHELEEVAAAEKKMSKQAKAGRRGDREGRQIVAKLLRRRRNGESRSRLRAGAEGRPRAPRERAREHGAPDEGAVEEIAASDSMSHARGSWLPCVARWMLPRAARRTCFTPWPSSRTCR